jgi:Mg2+/Co2+ transporter CorB
MNEIPLSFLVTSLIILIFLSGFFSSSETGMMSINRYRLKNLANKNHRGAMRVQSLLDRTDRLISVILIGNNFVNILASSISTIIGMRLFGDAGIAISTGLLTFIILIFAEVTPKTMAAISPERFAYPSSILLRPLLTLLYPFVWIVNSISRFIINLLGFDINKYNNEALDSEELRSVVDEAGPLIPSRHQKMLLSILDLESITVDDIMVPRNEIMGIDLNDSIEEILEQIGTSQHTRILVYTEDLNQVSGILHLRNISRLLKLDDINKAQLMQLTREPYFVPEGTPLHAQLHSFQKLKRRIGIVVDEYGDVQGLVTLEDILEEIVGEFTTDFAMGGHEITPQEDGSFILDGSASVREINRTLNWSLPVNGAKTISGILVEHLEFIPNSNICISLHGHLFETVQIKDNTIKAVKVCRDTFNFPETAFSSAKSEFNKPQEFE